MYPNDSVRPVSFHQSADRDRPLSQATKDSRLLKTAAGNRKTSKDTSRDQKILKHNVDISRHKSYQGLLPLLLGARTLLGAPGIATRNKKLLGAPALTTRNKKLLGAQCKNNAINARCIGSATWPGGVEWFLSPASWCLFQEYLYICIAGLAGKLMPCLRFCRRCRSESCIDLGVTLQLSLQVVAL